MIRGRGKVGLARLIQHRDIELLSTEGPSNAPIFEVAAVMDHMRLGVGRGSSKKRAEQKAAHAALDKLAGKNKSFGH